MSTQGRKTFCWLSKYPAADGMVFQISHLGQQKLKKARYRRKRANNHSRPVSPSNKRWKEPQNYQESQSGGLQRSFGSSKIFDIFDSTGFEPGGRSGKQCRLWAWQTSKSLIPVLPTNDHSKWPRGNHESQKESLKRFLILTISISLFLSLSRKWPGVQTGAWMKKPNGSL